MQDIKVRQLVEAARSEPVTLLDNGQPAAIVLSPSEFDRLDQQDRIRREARMRLRATMQAIQTEAVERGLTEADVERLLTDDPGDAH